MTVHRGRMDGVRVVLRVVAGSPGRDAGIKSAVVPGQDLDRHGGIVRMGLVHVGLRRGCDLFAIGDAIQPDLIRAVDFQAGQNDGEQGAIGRTLDIDDAQAGFGHQFRTGFLDDAQIERGDGGRDVRGGREIHQDFASIQVGIAQTAVGQVAQGAGRVRQGLECAVADATTVALADPVPLAVYQLFAV